MKRLPLLFFVAAVAIKATLIAAWGHLAVLGSMRSLLAYDPLGWWVAGNLTPLFFDPRRFAPPPAETLFFESTLVLVFAVQCFAAGVLIRLLVRSIQRRRADNISNSAVSGA
jgi:hypothetical protein